MMTQGVHSDRCSAGAQKKEHCLTDVSVVIAAKNEAVYVREAVASILAQEHVDFELVFVDDGSTDNTADIVRSFDDIRVRLLSNTKAGKVSAFNLGVAEAIGDWVCIFAGDDIMPAGSLAERWLAVKDVESDQPVVGLCRLITMSENKKIDGHVVPKDPRRGGLTGVSYLMDRRALGALFPVPENLPNEDTWLETAVLHLDLKLVHSGAIGCRWRVHSGNSINMLVPFDEFNKKLTPRMAAYGQFLEANGSALTANSRAKLEAKVRCEDARKAGNPLKIWLSGATVIERLRAISLSSRIPYEVRRKLYGLLSGW